MILRKSDPDSAEKTAEILKQEDIAIIPTDTIYGFSGIVPETEEKIRKLKSREEQKSFIRLIASPEELRLYTGEPVPMELLALWPGSLTLVVSLAVPNGAEQTAAFRCPGDQWLRRVIKQIGKPLYSTSVNRSRMPPLTAIDDIIREFGDAVPLIVSAGYCGNNQPSTIVDISTGICKVLRQGIIPVPKLPEFR
ncbi:MAG: L-threonylcarbamoyladenylate synthase [Treponema sp.]|jgi:L-threonylcarbamoyladenylate synthase|nr:L-threonylcarbamoyladenylate synthase [Treponema sp.]